jgi:carboxylesterase
MKFTCRGFRCLPIGFIWWGLLIGVVYAHPEEATEISTAYDNNTAGFELGPVDASTHCILVHGFAGSPLDFSELPTRLADGGLKVSVLRLPHHGTSARTLAQATPDELISAVEEAVVQSNELYENTVLIGFSMGGSIAAIVASRVNVQKLVLIAPFFEVTHRWYFGMRAETWNYLLGSIIRYIPKSTLSVQVNRREAVPLLFSNRWLPTAAVRTLVELGERAGLANTITQISGQVLVLHSTRDKAASYDSSFSNLNGLSNEGVRFIEMPERNNHHLLSDWDRELAYEHILDFALESE